MKKTIFAFSMLSFCSASFAQTTNDLATTSGHEIGFTISRYIYREPSCMNLKGFKAGIEYTGTYALEELFAKADLRYAYSHHLEYEGGTTNLQTGKTSRKTQDNIHNHYFDLRLLFGKDFEIKKQLLAPYIGFGYRYLFNDLNEYYSTSYGYRYKIGGGYHRKSHYWYIPIGLTHRMDLKNQAKLETTIEYDYFIRGKQVSELPGNIILKEQDLINKQSKGYGFRLSMMYNEDNWSVGPYYHYWNIKKSKLCNIYCTNGQVCSAALEPKNHTNEFGVKFSYKF